MNDAPRYQPPPFDEAARCAKCGYDAVHTEYKGALHKGCTLSHAYESYTSLAGWGMKEDSVDRFMKLMEDVPDHLERKCARCGHGWAEATVPVIEAVA